MLDQSLQVNLLAIFSLQAHLMVTHPMHAIRSLRLSLLDTGSQLVACIGHGHIPLTQGKMMQSLGVVTIGHLHLHQPTHLQIRSAMHAHVVSASCSHPETTAIHQQDSSADAGQPAR